MYSYLDEQRYEELKDYFEQIVLPQGRNLASEDTTFGQLQNIQISEIKGMISIKLMTAASKQLQIRSEIPAPVPNLEMDTQDLIKILGIYLDNAIEAAEQTVEKEVSLSITCNPDICILQITNSSLPVENIPILFTAEYSTKENHTGIGLYDASRILGTTKIFYQIQNIKMAFLHKYYRFQYKSNPGGQAQCSPLLYVMII